MNYLSSTVLARSNLDMLINTRVTTLTYLSSSIAPSVSGVTVAQSSTGMFYFALPINHCPELVLTRKTHLWESGHHYNITATKQVVLSAGTVASAQLLMLSGIGNASSLKANGITLRYNNSNVGQNLIVRLSPGFLGRGEAIG